MFFVLQTKTPQYLKKQTHILAPAKCDINVSSVFIKVQLTVCKAQKPCGGQL